MQEALETHTTFLVGFSKALKERGLLDDVLKDMSPEARRCLLEPASQRWWPGSSFTEAGLALVKLKGLPYYQQLAGDLVKSALGPIAAPLVKVTLAMLGMNPGSLLSRMGMLAGASMKGPTFEWISTGKTSGSLKCNYLAPVNIDLIDAGWKATFEYIFEMTKPGKILKTDISNKNSTFTWDFTW